MDLPLYLTNPQGDSIAKAQDNYHQQMNITLRNNLGPNGWFITNISDADLRVTPILDPNLSTFTTVANLAPLGAVWFVTDTGVTVQKVGANPTVLVQFSTTAYP